MPDQGHLSEKNSKGKKNSQVTVNPKDRVHKSTHTMKVFQVNVYCLVALPFVQVKNGVWGVYHFPEDDALTTNPVQADAVSFVENKGGVDPKLGSDLTQIYESYIRISEDSSDPSIPHAKEYISVDIRLRAPWTMKKRKRRYTQPLKSTISVALRICVPYVFRLKL